MTIEYKYNESRPLGPICNPEEFASIEEYYAYIRSITEWLSGFMK